MACDPLSQVALNITKKKIRSFNQQQNIQSELDHVGHSEKSSNSGLYKKTGSLTSTGLGANKSSIEAINQSAIIHEKTKFCFTFC